MVTGHSAVLATAYVTYQKTDAHTERMKVRGQIIVLFTQEKKEDEMSREVDSPNTLKNLPSGQQVSFLIFVVLVLVVCLLGAFK